MLPSLAKRAWTMNPRPEWVVTITTQAIENPIVIHEENGDSSDVIRTAKTVSVGVGNGAILCGPPMGRVLQRDVCRNRFVTRVVQGRQVATRQEPSSSS
jgi:hypothetical protein